MSSLKYVEKAFFGTTQDLKDIYKFTIINNKGTKVEIINYGATVVSFKVADSHGKTRDIVLGYDNLKGYENGDKFFGATIGRCANRISKASFKLNGNIYVLNNNEGDNHLHGGNEAFHRKVWDYKILDRGILLTYVSEDMEEGYPGRCTVNVKFTLTDDNQLNIEYIGKTTKDTILNPTNHSYFNLNGHSNGTILDHKLMVNADYYTPIKQDGTPNGEISKVENTPFDLRKPTRIYDIIKQKHQQLVYGKGLDHNYCIKENNNKLKLGATLQSKDNEIKLFVYTTLPGIQIYTGNNIEDGKGKNNTNYKKYSGICLETQYFPDSINIDKFASPILRKGKTYKSNTIYKVVTK